MQFSFSIFNLFSLTHISGAWPPHLGPYLSHCHRGVSKPGKAGKAQLGKDGPGQPWCICGFTGCPDLSDEHIVHAGSIYFSPAQALFQTLGRGQGAPGIQHVHYSHCETRQKVVAFSVNNVK